MKSSQDELSAFERRELKHFSSLQISDLEKHPVWDSILDDEADEASVFPVTESPVSDLRGLFVGTRVTLANGSLVWAMIFNVHNQKTLKNEHFVQLRLERNGQWFWLARYWDTDFTTSGPEALGEFLELPVDEIFPITYDVRNYALGEPSALANSIYQEPRQRLTEDEIIKMAAG